MREVYGFIGEEYYTHDFENVKQVTQENDWVHGIPDLHRIRNKVEPQPEKWQWVLGQAGEKYANMLKVNDVAIGQ